MRRRSQPTPQRPGPAHGKARLALLAGSLALATATAGVTPSASAQVSISGLGLSITPAFQSPVTVGQQDQPALVQFVNKSVGPKALVDTVSISNVRINPGCGGSTIIGGPGAPSPCGSLEPRPDPALPILDLDELSTAATTCPGGPFAITGPDVEGDYAFTPLAGPLTLAPVGQPGDSCQIHFTFDVVQPPNDGITFQAAALLATSPSYGNAVPETGVSVVTVNVPPTTTTTTTVAPTTTTTTAPVAVRVLPAVVTTVGPNDNVPSGGLAATGGEDMLAPGLALMGLGLLGLLSLRGLRIGRRSA